MHSSVLNIRRIGRYFYSPHHSFPFSFEEWLGEKRMSDLRDHERGCAAGEYTVRSFKHDIPLGKYNPPAFLDHPAGPDKDSTLRPAHERRAFRNGGDPLFRQQERIDGKDHRFIGEGCEEASLQKILPVQHVRSYRHAEGGAAVADRSQLNPHEGNKGIGISSISPDSLDIVHG